MSILIDETKRVLVQGITGREGLARTRLMKEYGTQILAGVTPGRGGTQAEGVAVFDTVAAACEALGVPDVSVLFIPAPLVKGAALEALSSGIKLLVIVPDRVPIYDVLEIATYARQCGAAFIGPNTLGLVSAERGILGMMGGSAANLRKSIRPGPVGVTSRSGGITTSIAYYLGKAGMGCSTVVHVGGDAVVGMPHAQVLRCFEEDDQTQAVVMYGEIGTSQEEDAASLIEAGLFTKPLIAYIGGKAAKPGTRFSHAGAIVEGDRGTYEGKVACLQRVGARIVEHFAELPQVTEETLRKHKPHPKLHNESAQKPPSPPPEELPDLHWKTAITKVQPNEIRLRGYRIDALMDQITFSQAIYLALTGKLPTPDVGRLIDAILVSSVDHAASPSTLAARTAASTGAPMNAALAAGLLSINQHHGGAIQNCMQMIQQVIQPTLNGTVTYEQSAAELVEAYKSSKRRLPGFGHRIHTADPRTSRLLSLAASLGLANRGVAALRALDGALNRSARTALPINVDGAIAAILIDLDISLELGNTFFMIARLPGLVAHIYEEQSRERPMRWIHPTDLEYDGPPDA